MRLRKVAALSLALLTTSAPVRAGSFLDVVFGHAQWAARPVPAPKTHRLARRHTDHVGRRGHDAGAVRASYYGAPGEYLNRHTANGEIFRPLALTCAHRSMPFGTRLRVTYRGRSVVVRVTDRGPALWTGRSLDLSRGAALAIGMTHAGVGTVTIQRM